MTVSLADLPKGHEFAATRLKLTPQWVAEYVGAVEDDAIGAMAGHPYPPLALATCSVRALLEQAALPEGAIHVGQELNFSLSSETESELVARAHIASRGERQGWVLMGIDLRVETNGGTAMMSGRATITFPTNSQASA
ncbi:MAG: hypothetical protein E6J43_08055 [Chloroflexi bacterium]|nr:MAG: hypothetical protein E6J43_08055 [Chloroflexota bacterium]